MNALYVFCYGSILALFDAFDAFVRKHSQELLEGECFELKRIAWGRFGVGSPRELRFFALRLPSWDWAYSHNCLDYRWGQRVLTWVSGGYMPGWRVNFDFN